MNSWISRSSLPFLVLFSSSLLVACNSSPVQHAQSGQCPQPRTTEMAPAASASVNNPLPANEDSISAGKDLYFSKAKPVACVECHGETGDGNGRMANMFEPAPRNFTCAEIVRPLPDGQLFWIIKYGSIGTSMPAFTDLSDEEIWQLTHYLRSLSPAPSVTPENGQTMNSSVQQNKQTSI